MHNKTLTVPFQVWDNQTTLPAPDQELIDQALDAAGHAYAPYSEFFVGAALRLTNGQIITGSNQENASFPIGQCAERVALYAAHTHYPDQSVEAMAIVAKKNDALLSGPITPCGACRQALLETELRFQHNIRLILHGTKATYIIEKAKHLLPLHFNGDFLV